MPDWSIKIVPSKSQIADVPAVFVSDIDGAKPGQPLKVEPGDLVSWNNTTNEEHWPWLVTSANAPPVDPPPGGTYLTVAPVQPNSSSPWFNVNAAAGTTLYYCSKKYPKMRGSIVVVAFGE